MVVILDRELREEIDNEVEAKRQMKLQQIDAGEYVEYLDLNKSTLLAEFAELYECKPEQVEDYYPSDFKEFCKDAFREFKIDENTKGVIKDGK